MSRMSAPPPPPWRTSPTAGRVYNASKMRVEGTEQTRLGLYIEQEGNTWQNMLQCTRRGISRSLGENWKKRSPQERRRRNAAEAGNRAGNKHWPQYQYVKTLARRRFTSRPLCRSKMLLCSVVGKTSYSEQRAPAQYTRTHSTISTRWVWGHKIEQGWGGGSIQYYRGLVRTRNKRVGEFVIAEDISEIETKGWENLILQRTYLNKNKRVGAFDIAEEISELQTKGWENLILQRTCLT